jgi:uncharacterized protein (TIGR02145 family)
MKKNIALLWLIAMIGFTQVVLAHARSGADTAKIQLLAKIHGGKTTMNRDSIYIDLELKNLSAQSINLPDIFGNITVHTYIAVTQDNGRVPMPIQVTFADYNNMLGIKYITIAKKASYKFKLNLSATLTQQHITLSAASYRLNFTYINKGAGIAGSFDAPPVNIIATIPPPPPKPANETGTFTDTRDGQVYRWVKIGNQVWMAQNLNYKTAEHSYMYNNDEANRAKYGMYYDFQVLQDIAPKGWHVPNDAEWQQMEVAAGLSADQANIDGYRGDMAATLLPGGESGFNLLYAGWHKQGFFDALDQTAYFWTTTQSGAPVYARMFKKGYNSIYRNRFGIAYGMSIRCVKDDAAAKPGDTPKKALLTPLIKQPISRTQTVVSNVVTFTAKPDTLPVKPFKPLTKSKNKKGTFVDERDGQQYGWVKIGKQVWMSQNLNYKSKAGLYYYPDAADTTNSKKEGLFYSFEALKYVCPKGWHIPSNAEWNELETSYGITADRQPKNGWHGDDVSDFLVGGASGFDLLWAGERKGSRMMYINERAYFWTTKEEESSDIYRRMFMKDHNRLLVGNQGIAFNLSVRCVKNDGNTP